MINNNKGNIVLLTIISLATLLVAVAGSTFAYFGATMHGSDATTTIEVTSGTLSTEYDGDSKLINGYVSDNEIIASKEITISGVVTGSNNLNYEAVLNVYENTYADGELVYTISSVNESNNGTIISEITNPIEISSGTSTIVLGTGVFAGPTNPTAIHKYIVTVRRVKTVDENFDKKFNGKMSVNQQKK